MNRKIFIETAAKGSAILIAGAIVLSGWGCSSSVRKAEAQNFTRDLNVDLLVNHVGYLPEAGKTVVVKGLTNSEFEVINSSSGQIVFEGAFKPAAGDFGDYSVGDFSAVQQTGTFYIKSDNVRSFPFRISPTVYRPAIDLIVGYFSKQRCGPSETGYMTPCHLDDGVRLDNGQHQDVTGGWHDASDLRKWVSATIYGMIGLSRVYELLNSNDQLLDKIYDELLWGNIYFLKMQESQGYVMNFVGGDIRQVGDNNRWTNNIIEPGGGEINFIRPTGGISRQMVFILGDKDDRVIQTNPAGYVSQYNFILSEAMLARIAKTRDANYSQICLTAAVKCFNWCILTDKNTDVQTIGASILAALELYKTTGEARYKDFAINKALELKKLQASKQAGGAGGFFYMSQTNREPYKANSQGPLAFISICNLAELFPLHQDAPIWKEIIKGYSVDYLEFFTKKNSFGIVPYGLFSEENPGGNRKAGSYWYRYFMHPEQWSYYGINANLASAGIGFLKAAKILQMPELKSVAQRQLDWITGANPFNSSTVVGIGYNHPVRFFNGGEFLSPNNNVGEFRPATPVLQGGVMNGLVGDKDDMPFLHKESHYSQSEYWTPMVVYTLWLMAEITMMN